MSAWVLVSRVPLGPGLLARWTFRKSPEPDGTRLTSKQRITFVNSETKKTQQHNLREIKQQARLVKDS